MQNKFILSVVFVTVIFCIRCQEDDKKTPGENHVLKASLQGTWIRVEDNNPALLKNQLVFDEHSVTWYDSTVNMFENDLGEIQTVRGKCPVKYTFKDGIQHYNPFNTTHVYTFSESTENNILWVFIKQGENSVVVDYSIADGLVSIGDRWEIPSFESYISSCVVRFTNNHETASFCDATGQICIVYEKVL